MVQPCSVGPVSDTSADLIAALQRILTARGPLAVADFVEAVQADAADFGPDPEGTLDDLLDDPNELFMPLLDGRWTWLPALLNGRIFTHRLEAVEAAHDILRFGADLAPALILTETDAYQRLADGTQLSEGNPTFNAEGLTSRGASLQEVGPEGALILPAGRFAELGVGAGDLIGLRVSDNGYEVVAAGTEILPAEAGAAMAELLDDHRQNQPGHDHDHPEMLDSVIWALCGKDDSAFRTATPPVTELIAAAGLAFDGDWVARPGFDFAGFRLAQGVEMIQANYQLAEIQAVAVWVTLGLFRKVAAAVNFALLAEDSVDEPDQTELASAISHIVDEAAADDGQLAGGMSVRAAIEFLADPSVSIAVLAETHSEDEQGALGLGVFADAIEPLAPRVARPALRWLRAKAHERLGDIGQAEVTLQAAESLNSDWPLTLMSLARYASDRGDAEGGLGLLRRAGAAADHELVVVLERFRPVPRTDIGRNDRCWCGSERKYKACHLNNELLPLEQRAVWLYHKAGGNLLEGEFGPLLFEAAQARSAEWDTPDALGRALQDELAIDVVLFEGGAFADFVETRGTLLPADERALADEWLAVDRSLHEVLSIAPGQGVTLRDVRTGDVQEVHAPAASSQVCIGDLYCARVVPVGDIKRIFGCFSYVAPENRDDVLALLGEEDADPVELVSALSR